MTKQEGRTGRRYSERIDAALTLAAAAHHEDVRKGTEIPYVMHPFHVGLILDRHGFNEDVVIAGILNDVLEDPKYGAGNVQRRLRATCPALAVAPAEAAGFKDAVVDYIQDTFGANVVSLVAHVTERKTDEAGEERKWGVRKREQLDAIANATAEQCAVKAADCLHNLRAMSRDLRDNGAGTMTRFNGRAAESLWYNTRATDLVSQKLGDTSAFVEELFGALHEFEEFLSSTGAVAATNDRDPWSGGLTLPVGVELPIDAGLWVFGPRGERIHGFGHWFSAAPPKKGAKQWRDHASAREFARAFTRQGAPSVPAELVSLFETNLVTHGLTIATAYPEHVTPLPVAPDREGRNHDLLALGMAGRRRVVIGVEAKAAEELGPEVGAYRRAAEEKNRLRDADERGLPNKSRRSKIPERINDCARRIFGDDLPEGLDTLRYQLVHAVAATLIESEDRRADLAVFVVHQFTGTGIDATRVAANWSEVERFIRMLLPSLGGTIEPGKLYGPTQACGRVAGGPRVELLIGEVSTTLEV